MPFRIQPNAASLKPKNADMLSYAREVFPHSTECGLIEAFALCNTSSSLSDFPHSTECGLIEALS